MTAVGRHPGTPPEERGQVLQAKDLTLSFGERAILSDQAMFLHQGRLVEHGDTAQMFEDPAQEETARYLEGRFG